MEVDARGRTLLRAGGQDRAPAADDVKVQISQADGPYRPWFEQVQLMVFGPEGKLRRVLVDGQSRKGARIEAGHAVAEIPWDGRAHEIEFPYGQ